MQDPDGVRELTARVTGLRTTAIAVHMTRSGGGFGRRLMSDYGAEAAYLSKAVGRAGAGALDPRRGPQPGLLSSLRACTGSGPALDAGGRVVAWEHRLANPSRYAYAKNGQPPVVSELYPDDFPARVLPHVRLAYTHIECGIPGGAWRSTLHSSNAFAVQSFVDELAHATGRDPLALRLELLGAPRQLDYKGHGGPVFDTGRLAGVLRLAAEQAGWGSPLPAGRARGHRRSFHLRQLRGARGGGLARAGRRSGWSGSWWRWTADRW